MPCGAFMFAQVWAILMLAPSVHPTVIVEVHHPGPWEPRPGQSLGVEGTLMCNNKPFKGATISLYDYDLFFPNDLMGSAWSDSYGEFRFAGTAFEMTTIDPFLQIEHGCNKGKTLFIDIPKSAITPGTKADLYYNVGRVDLV